MWEKQKILIDPTAYDYWWLKSHAMIPTIEKIDHNSYHIYFSGRDEMNVSHVGRGLISINGDEIKLLSVEDEPVFSIGERGCFDDNGVTPSCIVDDKLYYIGWNGGTPTYRMSLIMGLCIKNKDGKFIRNSRAPLMARTDREPFGICTAPFVIKDINDYKMWYVSGEGWITKDLPRYNIKYATSKDGIIWKNDGVVSLELAGDETALARPCVIKTNDFYEMYFSYKDQNRGYRIGHAISDDGVLFTRTNDKHNELDTSNYGWDSDMVEYSFVFNHNGHKFLLYNGNDYGKTGIGYAKYIR